MSPSRTANAAHVNRVTLVGRLGRDVETKTQADGQVVVSLYVYTETVAPEWHKVEYSGLGAKRMAESLRRGDAVAVEGRLRTQCYERKGEKRYSTIIVAARVVRIVARASWGAR